MTTATFRTSAQNSPAVQATNVVDATAGAEIITLELAASTAPNTQVTVIKSDASANTVTVKDAAGTTLGVLEVQNDAITLFCDGVAWSAVSVAAASGSLVAPQITEIHDTALNAKVLTISPGAATPVNFWNIAGSGTGAPLILSADGTDTDIDVDLVPKGAGRLQEAEVDVAVNCGSAQADSAAVLLSTLVTDFNALLAKLRTSRVLDP